LRLNKFHIIYSVSLIYIVQMSLYIAGISDTPITAFGYPYPDGVTAGLTIGKSYYSYPDVNSDPDLRNQMVRYYRDKVLQWLKTSFSDLLNYFAIRKGAGGADYVDYVKDEKEYSNVNRDSDAVKEKKIHHIRKILLSKKLIAKLLEAYTEHSQIKWWDLRKDKPNVKEYLHSKLRHKIKESLN
jgi:hypothetical protein